MVLMFLQPVPGSRRYVVRPRSGDTAGRPGSGCAVSLGHV